MASELTTVVTTQADFEHPTSADGVWDGVVWNPVNLGTPSILAPRYAGLQFDVPVSEALNAVGERLDVGAVVSVRLQVEATIGTFPPTEVSVAVDHNPIADPWSTASPPGSRPTERPVRVRVWGTSGPFLDTMDSSVFASSPGILDVELEPATIAGVVTNSLWTGNLLVSLTARGGASQVLLEDGAGVVQLPTVTLVRLSVANTGWITTRRDRTRAVEDSRLGFPSFSVDLVEDGFVEGVWVSERDWDPDDPYEEDRYVQSPLEGTVDDKPVR